MLRSVYGFAPDQIVKALAAFAGLPRVTLEDAALAATALDWTLKGMDFADALYLAKAQGCDGLYALTGGLRRQRRKSPASKSGHCEQPAAVSAAGVPKLPAGDRTIRPVRL